MMKKLRGECTHCGMPIEYAADAIGTVVPCPYCKKPTELRLAVPPSEPVVPKKAIVWTVVALVVLLLGLLGATQALKRAKKIAEERQPQPAATNPR